MIEPESRFYESMRLRLHYGVWGDESKPPLLLVHGSRDHARSWDFVAQRLTDRFCVYAPDLRGHGDSDWAVGAQYSIIEYVADIAKLVDIIDRGPVALVGHSLGGGVVMEYAGTMPETVSKLVSIEGMGRFRGMPHRPANLRMREYVARTRDMEAWQPRTYATLEDAAVRMQENNRRLSPEMAMHLTVHGTRRLEDGSYTWKFDNFIRSRGPYEWNEEDARSIWAAITAPVLLVGGAESWRFDARRDASAAVFRDMRSVTVEGAAHWVHHDQFERFVAIARDFLLA
ncbi:MAG TPA: alpha/beta hydrolase [Dehalococcoidia bacterium]